MRTDPIFKPVPTDNPTLAALIEAHRKAWEELEGYCCTHLDEDMFTTPELLQGYERVSEQEADSAIALFLFPTDTKNDQAAKREYILANGSLMDYFGYTPHVDRLINAVIELAPQETRHP